MNATTDTSMHSFIDSILISQARIAERVKQLAAQITADHSPPNIEEGEITIVPIMTGAMIFTSDLIRQIPIAMKIGLMIVSSYPGKSIQSRGSQILNSQVGKIEGRHVLVIDDILDSGGTLNMVVPALREMAPPASKAASCCERIARRPTPFTPITSVLKFPTTSSSDMVWTIMITIATCRTS